MAIGPDQNSKIPSEAQAGSEQMRLKGLLARIKALAEDPRGKKSSYFEKRGEFGTGLKGQKSTTSIYLGSHDNPNTITVTQFELTDTTPKNSRFRKNPVLYRLERESTEIQRDQQGHIYDRHTISEGIVLSEQPRFLRPPLFTIDIAWRLKTGSRRMYPHDPTSTQPVMEGDDYSTFDQQETLANEILSAATIKGYEVGETPTTLHQKILTKRDEELAQLREKTADNPEAAWETVKITDDYFSKGVSVELPTQAVIETHALVDDIIANQEKFRHSHDYSADHGQIVMNPRNLDNIMKALVDKNWDRLKVQVMLQRGMTLSEQEMELLDPEDPHYSRVQTNFNQAEAVLETVSTDHRISYR